MSPDPPREDTGDDDNIRRLEGEFIEGFPDDQEFFIIPDAPYELDMEEESEYSDSEEEEGVSQEAAQQNHAQSEGGESNLGSNQIIMEGQGRGRYRLLIPFPPATNSDSELILTGSNASESGNRLNDEVERAVNTDNDSNQQNIESNSTIPNLASSSSSTISSETPSTSASSEPNREIEMTNEKVEEIKLAMKNITLPAAAIPKWASEVDEDVWKRKLYDSLNTKTSKHCSSTNCANLKTEKN